MIAAGFDPAAASNLRTCGCGRVFNFVAFDLKGIHEVARCAVCSAPDERCPVCGEPVKTLPWVEHEGRRVHTDNGRPGKWNCALIRMMSAWIKT